MKETITLKEIRKALNIINEQRKSNFIYIVNDDCWIKADIAGNPFEIGLTPLGVQKIKDIGIFYSSKPVFEGEIKTIFGIPIVVTKGLVKCKKNKLT